MGDRPLTASGWNRSRTRQRYSSSRRMFADRRVSQPSSTIWWVVSTRCSWIMRVIQRSRGVRWRTSQSWCSLLDTTRAVGRL